jgi:very-short-patch-repair endonuclease
LSALEAPLGHAQYARGDRGSSDGSRRPVTVADFAWPEKKVAVFCDGWAHRCGPQQRVADSAKRSALEADGWTVLAFWGGEIVRDPSRCADQVLTHMGVVEPARPR